MTKKQAQSFISNSVRDSKLPPANTLKCVDCGEQAHDYDHYLGYEGEHYKDVQPVCGSCHKSRGVKRGEIPIEKCWSARAKPCSHGERSQRRCRECRVKANNEASARYRARRRMVNYQ